MTTLDDVIQQLNNHHETISSIQNTQASHSSMLETLHADTIDIKAALEDIAKSIADLNQKLDTQTPSIVAASTTSLLTTTAAGCMTTHPPSPKFPTPPPTSVVAAAPTPLTNAATNSTAPAPPLSQTPGPAAPFLHLLSLPTMAPSSPVKPYNSTHQILKSFSDSHIEFLFGIPDTLHIMSRKQLKIALNSFDKSKLVRAQIAIGCGAVFEQKYRKDKTSPYIKMLSESKVFVFDPGGTLLVARVFDLEDKVDLEGVGIDTHINQPTPEGNARPRRTISVHPEGS